MPSKYVLAAEQVQQMKLAYPHMQTPATTHPHDPPTMIHAPSTRPSAQFATCPLRDGALQSMDTTGSE